MVDLFHGTDVDAVAIAAQEGFEAPRVDGLVEMIADKFDLDPRSLLPEDSFEAWRRADDRAYVTPNFMHAAHYSTRSRELERMLFERAYDELFGRPEWVNDPEKRLWVRGQLPVNPVVAVMTVDTNDLPSEE